MAHLSCIICILHPTFEIFKLFNICQSSNAPILFWIFMQKCHKDLKKLQHWEQSFGKNSNLDKNINENSWFWSQDAKKIAMFNKVNCLKHIKKKELLVVRRKLSLWQMKLIEGGFINFTPRSEHCNNSNVLELLLWQ